MRKNINYAYLVLLIAVILLLLIQTFGVYQSYKLERFKYLESCNIMVTDNLTHSIYEKPENAKSKFSIDFNKKIVTCFTNDRDYVFYINTNTNTNDLHIQGVYDMFPLKPLIYYADSINSDFKLRGLKPYVKFFLKDSTNNIIQQCSINHYRFGEELEGKPFYLGFMTKHKLELLYVYPFYDFFMTAYKDISLVFVLFVLALVMLFIFQQFYKNEKLLRENNKNYHLQMVHNMRSPINLIKQLNEFEINSTSNDNIKEMRVNASVKCANVINTINNYLSVSITALGIKIKKDKFDIMETFTQVKELYDNLYPKTSKYNKDVDISIINKTESTIMYADAFHIEAALNNIVENAIKYSDDEVDIKIIYSTDKHHYYISIVDNGIGFDNSKRIPKSYGIGLKYARNVAKAHGGKLLIKSEKGEGSNVTLVIKRRK